jgi:hypothetical protein
VTQQVPKAISGSELTNNSPQLRRNPLSVEMPPGACGFEPILPTLENRFGDQHFAAESRNRSQIADRQLKLAAMLTGMNPMGGSE